MIAQDAMALRLSLVEQRHIDSPYCSSAREREPARWGSGNGDGRHFTARGCGLFERRVEEMRGSWCRSRPSRCYWNLSGNCFAIPSASASESE